MQEADMEQLFEMVIMAKLFHNSLMSCEKKEKQQINTFYKGLLLHCKPSKVYLSVVHLMLDERSRRRGPGSIVGSPVAEVVVVQVDEILLSNPGGKLRLSRCNKKRVQKFQKHLFITL